MFKKALNIQKVLSLLHKICIFRELIIENDWLLIENKF